LFELVVPFDVPASVDFPQREDGVAAHEIVDPLGGHTPSQTNQSSVGVGSVIRCHAERGSNGGE
jgi:hypothetical protein